MVETFDTNNIHQSKTIVDKLSDDDAHAQQLAEQQVHEPNNSKDNAIKVNLQTVMRNTAGAAGGGFYNNDNRNTNKK